MRSQHEHTVFGIHVCVKKQRRPCRAPSITSSITSWFGGHQIGCFEILNRFFRVLPPPVGRQSAAIEAPPTRIMTRPPLVQSQHLYRHTHIHTHTFVCVSLCEGERECVYTHMRVCVSRCIFMCVCVCAHTHTCRCICHKQAKTEAKDDVKGGAKGGAKGGKKKK